MRSQLAVVVAALALLGASPAAAEITPPPPVTFSPEGFEEITPIAPLSPSNTTATPGPRPPTPPRSPNLPSVAQNGPANVDARIAEIAAKVASLSQQVTDTGRSDGTGLNSLSQQELISALGEGRALFAGPVTAPQVEVDASGCPTSAPEGTLRGGSENVGVAKLCADSIAQAATPEAAKAIAWAFQQLGAPYACDGVGRNDTFRFDCSSLVTRAYYEGAGLNTAGENWAPSTRDLMPWDGVPLADWAGFVSPEESRPGDLLLYRSCTSPPCSFQHVVMKLADGYMLHTNRCGDVAHVTKATGTDPSTGFVVARRVIPEKA